MKVQYPNAEQEFTQDFATLRLLAGLVSRTELAFDMRSAADEVISQVERELDFCRLVPCTPCAIQPCGVHCRHALPSALRRAPW